MRCPKPPVSVRPRPIWVLFGLLTLTVLAAPLPGAAQATTREIALDAAQFEFAPGRVRVNQGDQVVVTLTASDVVHGFYLDGYGLERRVEPGIREQIAFTADKPGKFRFRCAVSCGSLHPFMIGELIVERNTPYWRAIGVVLVAAAGMLAHLWQSGKTQSFQEVVHGTG
jgi:heme/copper-type cytochrome/quinol oxidase subunit 2